MIINMLLLTAQNQRENSNQSGFTHKAIKILDFSWALLDYGTAIMEGIQEGLFNAGQDVVDHPIRTTLCLVAGEYVLAYQLAKIVCDVAEITITTCIDPKEGARKWDEYIAPINYIISAVSDKQTTLKAVLKKIAQSGIQWKAHGKMLGGVKSFFNITKLKALKFAKNNPLVQPEQYMTTPEGLLFRANSKSVNKVLISPNVYSFQSATDIVNWGHWVDLNKVKIVGREYAKINNRLYTRHAIERMVPKGFGASFKTGIEGRGIPVSVVEDVIVKGIVSETKFVNGIERICKTIDKVSIVLEDNIVITVLYKK